MVLLIGCLVAGAFIGFGSLSVSLTQLAIICALVYQVNIILPYIPFRFKSAAIEKESNLIHILSVNVYQYNNDYQALVDLVKTEQPDILLTMESDEKWEQGMQVLEESFAHSVKVPFNNTYGMHLYTNLKVHSTKKHFFIAEDRPTIYAHLEDTFGSHFQFWGVHPPPPSPTEEPTSKPKDGELMCVAKAISAIDLPAVVVGDFNTVCWSASSKLFAKAANLNDARRSMGIKGTFPTKPWAFRFPIDLLFCSDGIQVNELETLRDIGSDHLPLSAKITVYSEEMVDTGMDPAVQPKVESIIEEGRKEHQMNQMR